MVLSISLLCLPLRAQFIPKDKQYHFAAGAVGGISGIISSNPKKAFWIGVGVGTAAGIAKELYDIKHGTPEVLDAGFTIAGSVVSSFLIMKIKKAAHKRTAQKKYRSKSKIY